MDNINQICQRILFAIADLHWEGYECLRIMPTIEDDEWVAYIGHRDNFSKADGAYIPRPMRQNCARFSLKDLENFSEARSASLTILSDCFSPLGNTETQEIISRCKGRDPEYMMWFLQLCGIVTIANSGVKLEFSDGIPIHKEYEIHRLSGIAMASVYSKDGAKILGYRFPRCPLIIPPTGVAAHDKKWSALPRDEAILHSNSIPETSFRWRDSEAWERYSEPEFMPPDKRPSNC